MYWSRTRDRKLKTTGRDRWRRSPHVFFSGQSCDSGSIAPLLTLQDVSRSSHRQFAWTMWPANEDCNQSCLHLYNSTIYIATRFAFSFFIFYRSFPSCYISSYARYIVALFISMSLQIFLSVVQPGNDVRIIISQDGELVTP